MTEQEAFDRIWDHFVVRRNPKSVNENGRCMYRGQSGARCAVGVLIPDEAYLPAWEGRGASVVANALDIMHLEEFLNEAQAAHDYSCDPLELKDRLQTLARNRGLTVPA